MKIEKLEKLAMEHKLIEYLKNISISELYFLQNSIYANDIIGIRVDVLSAIKNELEYRLLSEYISIKDSNFLSKGFDLRIRDVNEQNEIINSFVYYDLLNLDYRKIIKWCPILIYNNKVKKIYTYLKEQGKSTDDVVEYLCNSFDACIELSNSLKELDIKITDDEMKELINEIYIKVSNEKKGTESYNIYIDETIANNRELFKRLS